MSTKPHKHPQIRVRTRALKQVTITDASAARPVGRAAILEHDPEQRSAQPPAHHGMKVSEAVRGHVEANLGPVGMVFSEVESDNIALDLLVVPATEARPYHVLCTSGMSDLPMTVPESDESPDRAELLILLPASWPLDLDSFQSYQNYWPLFWLKEVARLPHQYGTWVSWGHTVPNGDPAEPIADTGFTGVMVTRPYFLPSDFERLETPDGTMINFYLLFPLYPEELELALNGGANGLESNLARKKAPLVIDPQRKNTVR